MRSGGNGGKIDAVGGQSGRRSSVNTQLRRRITRVKMDMVGHAGDDHGENIFRTHRSIHDRQSAWGSREFERSSACRANELYCVISGRNFVHGPLSILQIGGRTVVE